MGAYWTAALICHVALSVPVAVSSECSAGRCDAESAGSPDEVSQLQLSRAALREHDRANLSAADEHVEPYEVVGRDQWEAKKMPSDLLNPDLLNASVSLVDDGPSSVPSRKDCICSQGQSGCGPDEVADDGYLNILPGGETQCLDGSDYYFTYRKGDSKKLHIHFQGGGACWDPVSFNLRIPRKGGMLTGCNHHVHPMAAKGVLDESNPDNPWAEYSFVIINYCSGDMHSGHADRYWSSSSADPVKIRGLANAWSAVSWAKAHFPSLDQLTISGSSAGSLGIQLWSRRLLRDFQSRSKDMVVIGDSFIGVLYPPAVQLSSEARLISTWDLCQRKLLTFMEHRQCKMGNLLLANVWEQAMIEFRKTRFVTLNSKADELQIFFEKAFEATLGNLAGAFMSPIQYYKSASLQMRAWFLNHPNYFVYQVDGTQHMFLPEHFLHATPLHPHGGGTDGLQMVSWLSDIVQTAEGAHDRTVCTGKPILLDRFTMVTNTSFCAKALRTR